MVAPTPSGYSADVRLELVAGDRRSPVAQIGGGRIVFDVEVILPGSGGEVIANIDQHERRWKVTWAESVCPRRAVEARFHDE